MTMALTKRVAICADWRYISRPHATGVDKHLLAMSRGLAAAPGVVVELLVAADQRAMVAPLNDLAQRRLPLAWRQASLLWTGFDRPAIDRWAGDVDWVYCPRNDWVPVRGARYAVTIHGAPELDPDMPPMRTAAARLWAWRNRTQYRKMCRHADVVLTVSSFLQERIIDWFDCDPAKIAVVGNGVESCFFDAGDAPGGAVSNTVLAVGGLNDLDGGDTIVALGEAIRRRDAPLRIVVAGNQHREDLRARARATGVIDLAGYLPAAQLAARMVSSLALYYPTRYETFGMAAVEAMAAGLPVVTWRSTAVPEIVGAAALYVDPANPDAVLDALLGLQAASGERSSLIHAGRVTAQRHTWPACVERLRAALQI